jgi:3-methyladenine DNA glycosylase/8-oxoguanine DNA glycosylase
MDGVLRSRGGVLERLIHQGAEPVHLRVAQTAPDTVLFGARSRSAEAARYGIERMRFALGVDEELGAFYREFARDPLIGRSIRERPWLRPRRRPEPFEALAWAICEQLIEYERAAAIQRRIVAAMGPRWTAWGECEHPLRDVPAPLAFAGTAPARLESFDLAGSRARLLVRVAREVAGGRLNLHDADHKRARQRLLAIPGVGPWTVEMLALHGQGRYDQLPAGDVGLLKYVGRCLSGGDPHARAGEREVRSFFARYGPWQGLAAVHVGAI